MSAVITLDRARSQVEPQRPRRRHRRVVGALATLLAVVASMAVASFLTDKTEPSNKVAGGSISVGTSNFPLTFEGQFVYPTDATKPTYTVTDMFSLNNDNPVALSYALSASCADCTGDAFKQDQFNNLYLRLTPTLTDGGPASPGATTYTFRLNQLDHKYFATLGAKSKQAYSAEMWLANTATTQAQGVTTNFTVVVTGQAPPAPTPPPGP